MPASVQHRLKTLSTARLDATALPEIWRTVARSGYGAIIVAVTLKGCATFLGPHRLPDIIQSRPFTRRALLLDISNA